MLVFNFNFEHKLILIDEKLNILPLEITKFCSPSDLIC